MRTDKDFFEWYQTATQEEKELAGKVGEYEKLYFEDMTFKADSILHDFMSCEAQGDNGERGERLETIETIPGLPGKPSLSEKLSSVLYSYLIKISRMRGCEGRCDLRKQIIYIHPKYTDDETVILHEMIHAYEGILLEDKCGGQILRDMLTFCLYNSLKPRINDLDRRIAGHSHIVRQERITAEGGLHSILFFLKSLDLDLRLGLKPGTVCGYGRDTQ